MVHDISLTGLLIETSAPLSPGGHFEVQIPEAGTVEAEVIWNSGRFFGCRFSRPISKAALSAALLRSQAYASDEQSTSDPMSHALVELRALSARVGELGVTVEDLIQELGKQRTARKPLHDIDDVHHIGQEEAEDDRLPLPTRLRIILALSVGSWVLILWALGFI